MPEDGLERICTIASFSIDVHNQTLRTTLSDLPLTVRLSRD